MGVIASVHVGSLLISLTKVEDKHEFVFINTEEPSMFTYELEGELDKVRDKALTMFASILVADMEDKLPTYMQEQLEELAGVDGVAEMLGLKPENTGPLPVSTSHVAEIKALIATGDCDLTERKDTFAGATGRTPNIDDEGLIVAIAATNDDDDEEFINNVKHIEEHGYQLAA